MEKALFVLPNTNNQYNGEVMRCGSLRTKGFKKKIRQHCIHRWTVEELMG